MHRLIRAASCRQYGMIHLAVCSRDPKAVGFVSKGFEELRKKKTHSDSYEFLLVRVPLRIVFFFLVTYAHQAPI
jgi:hypothetical protein